ncbi:hypothetical protein A2763_01650 [Candidatus Kaiserbacteria bacterium RIFCSPHIGHO2_01_FULL_54_36]|uniref:Uncharacterized protein n=1 Tax=Candidatus Kaiserbacteria bacterium RIFCSPHIGHO2_01_FULL_54_36 TaxID=1798482 RepID=A0A1F6CMM3_9BACT|nr:MAG: hypothetical protein A2763_01650 [Candidatus Kaiserbacteria bacterium RIFCSPHIGHO2_01_FULL_54_36]OGG75824.1 MAG: hypothetical protein A3A41_02685 [Candidatus Kaiserbacteria bacterium RIFCSPLOWO2_01_FULL_54_22]
MSVLILEILTLVIAAVTIYFGIKILRQSDEEFIEEGERKAREIAKREKRSEESVMKQFVSPLKVNTRSWRLYMGGRGIALGFVLIVAFFAILIYHLYT